MCICDKLAEVTLSHRSVEKLMRLEGVTYAKIVRRMLIDERPLVLVQGINERGRKVHELLCPGDVLYRKEKRTLPDGTTVIDRVTYDTFHCARKEKFRNIVLGETVGDYRKGRFSYDPAVLIMSIFQRVSSGEYLGEFSPGIIYVQEVAEILSRVYPTRPGLLTAKTFCMFAMRKRRYAHSRPTFFLSLGLPIEKAMGHLEADNTVRYVPLTNDECRMAAFFEDTNAIIEKLIVEKKLSLHGMILCSPFPDEVPDSSRVLLPAGDPFAVYTREAADFTLQVQRHYNPENATLCIFTHKEGQVAKCAHTKHVHLYFGAPFGLGEEDVIRFDEAFNHFVLFGKLR